MKSFSRRDWMVAAMGGLAGVSLVGRAEEGEPVSDIHQHTSYSSRSHGHLRVHHGAMRVLRAKFAYVGKWQRQGREALMRLI